MTVSKRLLIEDWLPIEELGIESRREAAPIPGQFPKLKTLHVWWARRPLAASSGTVLASVLPAWSVSLAEAFSDHPDIATEKKYRAWVLRLAGVWGDPVAAKRRSDANRAAGIRTTDNPYGYKPAFRNSPSTVDLALLHAILMHAWGEMPSMIDPTAGGGSLPFVASRYGLPVVANDLNSVAAVVLRGGVETPQRLGLDLMCDLRRWGEELTSAIVARLEPFFPPGPNEQVANYLFARTVRCPRTGKAVPLSPNWWISKEAGKQIAVRFWTERDGSPCDEPEFAVVLGTAAAAAKPDEGTISRGTAKSPWDGLVIDGDYIKTEAQAGRMGSMLYAVAVRTPQPQANGRVKWIREFRSPTQADIAGLWAAEVALQQALPAWEAASIVPSERIEPGLKTSEPLRYGIRRWRDMFSPRQLLVHGAFVEEFKELVPKVRSELTSERATAVLGLLGLMQGKALNFNAILASWHASRGTMRSVFERHDLAFKWTYAEFEGARELYPWCLEQILDAYEGIASLLQPSDAALKKHPLSAQVPGEVRVIRGSAGDLKGVPDSSHALVCIDPPYYDNVMYGELSDFFGVWEQHTVGMVWPDLMPGGPADLKNEAVANVARFADAGRRRGELADADYEAKMQAIFAECHRVLRDDGVMTVMFTHKRAEAWDTLGMALLEAGFSIETSWPVNTESEQSLHQAKKNSAASTIMLVCRKRTESQRTERAYFEDVEADVRHATRAAVQRFEVAGIDGVDLLLATYGPALSVLSRAWPVYSSEVDESGRSRLLRPEEALAAAREEVVRLRKAELVGRDVAFDPITDFVLIAWQTFKAEEFPYDEARRLALAIGGGDVETLAAEKVVDKKAGTVTLLGPKDRMRRVYRSVLEGQVAGRPLVDVLHAVMIESAESGHTAAKALCDRLGLLNDQRFIDLVQAMVRAVPNTKLQGKWVRPEAEVLHGFCTAYLPQVELPEDPLSTTLFALS